MKKIPSFTIDHIRLFPGIYVSRKDVTPSGDVLTTFDVRMTAPNREPALSVSALHTIEHLAATFLRNNEQWKERVVYWGPIGCCPANYLILLVDLESTEIHQLIIDTFEFVSKNEGEVHGANAKDCWNYLLMNLPGARYVAQRYLSVLKSDECRLVYPD